MEQRQLEDNPRIIPPALKTVPGYYEPVFYWDEVRRYLDENALQEKLSTIYEAAWANTNFGTSLSNSESSLLKTLQGKPSADIDRHVSNFNSKPSAIFVTKLKTIQAFHRENLMNIKSIFAQLKNLAIGSVDRLPNAYPPHYGTFFNDENKISQQALVDFFSDYSAPRESQYNQNAFFLICKQKSRSYALLANDLVTSLEKESKPEKNTRAIKNFRGQLVKQMLAEDRPFEKSHLLRRIDYALEKIKLQEEPIINPINGL